MAFYSPQGPRVQIIFVSICCVLLIAGAVVYADKQKSSLAEDGSRLSVARDNTPSTQVDENSSDSWKDQFITTKSASSSIQSSEQNDDTPQTLTDQLGRNFFVNYIGLKQNNMLNDDEAIQSVVDNLIYSTALQTPEVRNYSIMDLRISSTNDVATIKNYGNNVALVFNTYGPKSDSSDIAKEALEKSDMRILAQMDTVINAYNQTITMLLATEVPYESSAFHLKLINALSLSKYVAEGLRKIDSDPAMSLLALNDYVNARQDVYDSLIGLKNIFTVKGVYYDTTEPGILFSTII